MISLIRVNSLSINSEQSNNTCIHIFYLVLILAMSERNKEIAFVVVIKE